ncbi:MAG: TVP38/TMEM64 family protein [Methylococcales bacterium]|nr:TVP38/TMEM64 family protein [Methylococcales bacterium]
MNEKKSIVRKIVVLFLIAVSIAFFIAFDIKQYLTLEFIQSQQTTINEYTQNNFITSAITFFIIYVITTAFSLPGAVVLTLFGGAIFGLLWGTLIISFASTIGATIAFLISRFILGKTIQHKFASNLKTINEGIEKEGAIYLLTLRLIPAFPFFIINLLMGLTKIKTFTYYWVSQIGMLAGTLVYVYAGQQFSTLTNLSGIMTPKIILAFVLLASFPFLARKLIEIIKKRV